MRRAWKRLNREQEFELIEWFRQEVRWLDTFQAKLVRYLMDQQQRDPGTWPELEPMSWYESAEHTPDSLVRRKKLPRSSSILKRQRERFLGRRPTSRLDSAWVYDYASRELRRVGRADDPKRIFENALAGFPPDLDLAQALVEMQLDDGAQRKALSAFSHAYANREGKVFVGLTLYDAWSSGSSLEMPDVDCLGIVHDVLDDWSTWRAPVQKQDSLYKRIGELFEAARRHRGLRRALAQTYLVGSPALSVGYSANLDALHSLWDSVSSNPEQLRAKLPNSDGWSDFLTEWTERCDAEDELYQAGLKRHAYLDSDAGWVRATLVRVMKEFAAADK